MGLKSPSSPAYEQQDSLLTWLVELPLPQSIKRILIFPRALIKDLSINDTIPHRMILEDISAAVWQDSEN